MMETIPWYRSTILRQQIVQLIVAALTLIGVSTDQYDIDGTVGLLLGGVTGAMAVWTMLSRLYRPNLPITEESAGQLQAAVKKQGGFARPFVLAILLGLAVIALPLVSACTGSGTRAAYTEAKGLDEQAYVLAEHYASLVEQAAVLKAKPTTPAIAVARMQQADQVAKPLVLRLRPLRNAYVAAKNATTEAELQLALSQAVLAIADLVRAVQTAKAGA